MDSVTLVAILATAGTLIGSGSGILIANKLVNYRLELLEKTVIELRLFSGRLSTIESNCGRRLAACEGRFVCARRDLDEHILELHPGHDLINPRRDLFERRTETI